MPGGAGIGDIATAVNHAHQQAQQKLHTKTKSNVDVESGEARTPSDTPDPDRRLERDDSAFSLFLDEDGDGRVSKQEFKKFFSSVSINVDVLGQRLELESR
eukprot:CAMPEP_0180780382 /NCGR_PEP_ID=MMETSP1038_2-20121128/46975_1 /TAXON_ID=632150 /ORGANISM="Azadinium spinosum, Strain 3D9" /LENGTH=100 /DNA_ID=CAMNT_0022815909 /DNA_START=59 /DNA_END=361 /DNA_ORIENTATION=-